MKNKYIIFSIIFIIALVVITFVFYRYYKSNAVDIDFFKDGDVIFSGYDKYGTAKYEGKVSYEGNDSNIKKFIASIQYKLSDEYSLYNGKVITVTATYDKGLAKVANVNLGTTTKEFVVQGLEDDIEGTAKYTETIYNGESKNKTNKTDKSFFAKDYDGSSNFWKLAAANNAAQKYGKTSSQKYKILNIYDDNNDIIGYKVEFVS